MNALRQAIREQTFGFLMIPGLVALSFIALAIVLVLVDRSVSVQIIFAGDASGARQVLSAIGASLITVAGLSFSITIITFQLVSSQFSPRALRGFLGDRVNQVIAGMFVGTFAYCLLVLGTVRDESQRHAAFVPGVSVSVAILLAIIALGALLLFIHHMSQAIQVSKIAAGIGHTALRTVDELYPVDPDDTARTLGDQLVDSHRAAGPGGRIYPDRPGFVASISLDDMIAACRRSEQGGDRPGVERRLILVTAKPGDFVSETTALAELWPPDDAPRLADAIRRTVRVNHARDAKQDVGYPIRQLVDIALRAISPAVNDPTTAVTCLGYLQAIMERLAGRQLHAEVRRSEEQPVVVVTTPPTFEMLATEAFTEIGRYGASDSRLIGRVLEAIEATVVAAASGKVPARAAFLVDLAGEVAVPAIEQARTDAERRHLSAGLEAVRRRLMHPAEPRSIPEGVALPSA